MTNTILTLLSAQRLRDTYAAGYWREETLYAVTRIQAERTPDAPAFRDGFRRLGYAALVEHADRLAADLHAKGVKPGQRVAVWLPSRAETAIAMLACARNGYVFCPSLHRNNTVGEIVELMERMRAAAFIGEAGYGADADRHDAFARARSLETMKAVYALPPLSGEATDAAPFSDSPPFSDAQPAPTADPDSVVYLAFTSGTTGKPKGVMHSDNTLLANARTIATDWSFGPDSVIYTLSPLSHNLGLGALISALAVGAELVVHDLPKGASLADRLLETGASFVFGVPAHAVDLLTEMRERPPGTFAALQGFRISGAAAPRWVIQELLDHGVVPQSGYGMTEACSHHYTLPDDRAEDIVGSSGKACPGYEVKIFRQDDPETELAAEEVGQIGGRGASLMLGYYDDQAATEDAFNSQGWFMTGDLGWMDERGYLRITGRKKDLIIRGGHNIYPARIESLAARHPEVEMAAAVPVPDDRLGERVCLIVLPRPGKRPEATAILAHLDAEGLSKFDMPEFFLRVEEFPLTASGKILKRGLQELIEKGHLKPVPVRKEAR